MLSMSKLTITPLKLFKKTKEVMMKCKVKTRKKRKSRILEITNLQITKAMKKTH